MSREARPSVLLNRPARARMSWFPPGKKDKAGRPVNVWTNFEASSSLLWGHAGGMWDVSVGEDGQQQQQAA